MSNPKYAPFHTSFHDVIRISSGQAAEDAARMMDVELTKKFLKEYSHAEARGIVTDVLNRRQCNMWADDDADVIFAYDQETGLIIRFEGMRHTILRISIYPCSPEEAKVRVKIASGVYSFRVLN